MNKFYFFLTLFVVASCIIPVYAIEPDEILVLANKNAAKSNGLAAYYMDKRKIPEKNLLQLWVTDKEYISRKNYDKKVVVPVRQHLEKEENRQIRCIVSMFGLPLKIGPKGLSHAEKLQLAELDDQKETILKQIDKKQFPDEELEKTLKKQLSNIRNQIKQFKQRTDSSASFDSELALVKTDDYNLNMWIPNPYFLGFKHQKFHTRRWDVLITSRLDGPSARIVKRIIDDGISAEKEGLKGRAYFDARWKNSEKKKASGYGFYDKSIHRAADFLEKEKIIHVTKDDKKDLFQPGDCPEAALYCGWYRLANYLDAFDWQPGSVGYHIASQECQSLRSGKYWCVKMLEDGICATIGPVDEPYVQAFAVPEIFFKYLTEGYLTLAEAYFISLPYLSWKMVLVGDPLYRVNMKNRASPQ
ncbi:TIGR03790 family protein [Desulfobacula phenolica]|uniref:TIGR03790 family protein n=1 Tax=Desulfobacula phenolica TaxID=90732 RepID=A0A1H2EQ73_9BACT|nr:TIGR03790 family protein [Desulfobacula phenolica]SDT97179.1 TIGR03790 family protein [Desulfobacula phenolica]